MWPLTVVAATRDPPLARVKCGGTSEEDKNADFVIWATAFAMTLVVELLVVKPPEFLSDRENVVVTVFPTAT